MTNRPPIFVLLFVSIFGFIGITVLVFLWGSRGFGAPPLLFKVFGSFIAIGFILMGFGLPLTALMKRKNPMMPDLRSAIPSARETSTGNYDCPHCGANIGDGDVSPSGDIKCEYCDKWWNIHA